MLRDTGRGLATVALLSCAGLVCAGGLTAREPLTAPLFSIDRDSPSILFGLAAADGLRAPGPTIEIDAVNLSLFDENDDLDGLSFDNALISSQTFVLIFSVDRFSVGGVPPDPGLVAQGLPYNVQDQAAKNQAAGDAYMSLALFDRAGPVLSPPAGRPRRRAANNTLVLNQGDAGGTQFSLKPDISPAAPNRRGVEIDDVDAGAGTEHSAARAQTEYVFFSVTRASPSLPSLPSATPSGADVFIDHDPHGPGGEILYVDPYALGLQPEDDINAFTVFDDGDHAFMPGVDQVIFSLSRDSPSLGTTYSPADIFSSYGTGFFVIYGQAGELGLSDDDNLNMLDFVLCDAPFNWAYYWAIGHVAQMLGPGGATVPNDMDPVPGP